jgi:carboxyl-terminal processing protease
VNRFSDTTTDEFRQAVKKVKSLGAQNLILDLTGNGGGYMNRAIEMADEFLSAGKLIVYTQGRSNPRMDYNATARGEFEKGKIVVLIDEGSASASEIVTGAIQDWDRGLVIGRRSFGKGLVQKTVNLNDGGAMRMTVARYYTPAGRNIQKPYEEGYESYQKDLSTRFEHGEFTVQDSIHLPDSLKFYTSNNRMVYGGGGIMPDIFVPLDTSLISKYYTSVFRKGILNQFILNHLDNNRKGLMVQYPNAIAFKQNFKVDEALLGKFTAFAEKEGVEKNEADLKTSDKLLRIQIKALLARNLWDLEAFYLVINDINDGYQKALEVIKDNTFDKMKIVSN